MTRTEQRTLRSKRQRALLWYAADGKCQRCGESLGDDWEADHIVPWVRTKRTNVHEMQALCATCNRKKGTMSYRQHQQEFDGVCRQILAGRDIRRVILSVTPGGGKSLLPQIAAHLLIPTIIDKICWVVPRDALRDQATRNFIAKQDRQIVGHSLEIRATTKENDPSRGTAGFSTTYQALASDPGFYAAEFKRHRYALILDEPHHLFLGDPWYRGVADLIGSARLQILMSGTWDRQEKIAGIDYIQDQTGLWVPDIPDRLEVRGDTAYIRYSRQTAIQEGAIKELRLGSGDGPGEFINRDGQTMFLDSFATAGRYTRELIFTALRTEYATKLISKWMGDYIGFRQHRQWAKAIAIAPTIQLARTYLKYIKQSYPTMRADIAVSLDENDKPDAKTAKDTIRRFKKKYDDPDALDVIATVAMCYEGLDVQEITHLVFLTHVRERWWVEQALARAARVSRYAPYNEQFGHIYCPNDDLINAVIEIILGEQNQGIKERVITPPSDPKEPRDLPTTIIALRGDLTRVRATDLVDGNGLTYQETAHLEAIINDGGVRGVLDPIGLNRMIQAAQQTQPHPFARAPLADDMPGLTVREREKKLRDDIEFRARQVDSRRDNPFGTYNGELRRRFGKSRDDMNETELLEVWKWLTANGSA